MRETRTQDPAELLNEIRTLVQEAEKTVANSETETSNETVAALRARFDAAQERMSHLYDDTKKKVIAGAKHTDEVIREKPYQALAIAVGVGVLVGVLLGRRNH